MAIGPIDIARERDEAARVDAVASALPCPNCHAERLYVKHLGIDENWQGIYAPGCYICGYVEGKGVVDIPSVNPGSTKFT